MSLPAGFGNSTDHCPTCMGRVIWDQVSKEFACKSGCKRNKEMVYPDGINGPNEIPFTKHQLGIGIWYGMVLLALLGCGFALMESVFLGVMLLVMVIIFANIFGFMIGTTILGWTMKETLPWLTPILSTQMQSKYHFKKELDYGGK